jgi:HD-GYP domain-containing protein (c-di-GMP phosphodiesterase class II)
MEARRDPTSFLRGREDGRPGRGLPKLAPRVVGLYVVLSALWIAFSDRALLAVTQDPALIGSLQTAKGLAFVAAVAMLLYSLISTHERERERTIAQTLRAQEALAASREETMRAIGLALEFRDFETKGHTDRVAGLLERLGLVMGFTEETREALRFGAYLHDVGKIAVADSILLKPDRLTTAEFDVMKRHPRDGFDLLRRIPTLPTDALSIVLHHHERWDGSGYPDGLAGEAIPLAARVFAVIDVYDALMTARPYKPAWSAQAARAEIRAQAGRHFDPRVVGAFLMMLGDAPLEGSDPRASSA